MDLSNVVFIENNQKGKKNNDKKSWTEVPPTANEPLTKRRYGKVYHYCHYCKYWGLHQPGKGKNCKRVEPLAELKSAFGDNGAFGGNGAFQSTTWFGNCAGTSQRNAFGSSTTGPFSGGVASEVPNNPPFGVPLPEKKSVFSDNCNSAAGWGAPAKPSIFGGGPAMTTAAKPSPFAVGVDSRPVADTNRQPNSLFGASSNMSVSTTNQCSQSSFGTGTKTGLFGSSNVEKPFVPHVFGPAAPSFGFPNPDAHIHSSFSTFGATIESKETRAESRSLFGSQNHSSFSAFGTQAPAEPKAPKTAPQSLFGSSSAFSFGSSSVQKQTAIPPFGLFGKPVTEDQKSSSLFGPNERSFGFSNASATTQVAPPAKPTPEPRQNTMAFPTTPPSEGVGSFNFNFPSLPSASLPSTQPASAPPTAQHVAPSGPAECAAASRQSSVPSFLYDHYPSHASGTTAPTTWAAPASYYSTDVYSLQVMALETKRQEVAQYLAH